MAEIPYILFSNGEKIACPSPIKEELRRKDPSESIRVIYTGLIFNGRSSYSANYICGWCDSRGEF